MSDPINEAARECDDCLKQVQVCDTDPYKEDWEIIADAMRKVVGEAEGEVTEKGLAIVQKITNYAKVGRKELRDRIAELEDDLTATGKLAEDLETWNQERVAALEAERGEMDDMMEATAQAGKNVNIAVVKILNLKTGADCSPGERHISPTALARRVVTTEAKLSDAKEAETNAIRRIAELREAMEILIILNGGGDNTADIERIAREALAGRKTDSTKP